MRHSKPSGTSPHSSKRSGIALLLIDCINDLDFPGNEEILQRAVPMAKNIAALRRKADETSVPVVYVNDHFGDWTAGLEQQVSRCLSKKCPGHQLVRILRPRPSDFFVLKPKHSGFYHTSLEVLLGQLKATTLVLTGLAGNICVLFTAQDAYLRELKLFVPQDCIASRTMAETRFALRHMKTVLQVDTRRAAELDLSEMALKEQG